MSVVSASISLSSALRSANPGRTCFACSLSSAETNNFGLCQIQRTKERDGRRGGRQVRSQKADKFSTFSYLSRFSQGGECAARKDVKKAQHSGFDDSGETHKRMMCMVGVRF